MEPKKPRYTEDKCKKSVNHFIIPKPNPKKLNGMQKQTYYNTKTDGEFISDPRISNTQKTLLKFYTNVNKLPSKLLPKE